eukprot:jgi/Mesvir1/218/Mv13562-RA.1
MAVEYSLAEVKKHNGRGKDMWIVINNEVYDVTKFAAIHPGGSYMIEYAAGVDASDLFHAFHHPRVQSRLATYYIGDVKADTLKPVPADLQAFRALRDEVWKEGLFDQTLGFHVFIVSTVFALFAAAVLLPWLFPSYPVAVLLGAVCLGSAWEQSLLCAHDFCHTGVLRNRKWDHRIGTIFGTALSGIGKSWWCKDHNEHHAFSHCVDIDPSAGVLPILTVHLKQIRGRRLDWLHSFFLRIQQYIYFPVAMVLGRYNLYVMSAVLSTNRKVDFPCFGFFIAYMACLHAFVVPPGLRIAYFVLANFSLSILHLILNVNHYFMPMLKLDEAEEIGFFHHQLATTADITANSFLGWYFGGLQYQIEHHLFPTMPRGNLYKVKQRVKDIAKKHNIPFIEGGFFWLNCEVFKTLDYVSHAGPALGRFTHLAASIRNMQKTVLTSTRAGISESWIIL